MARMMQIGEPILERYEVEGLLSKGGPAGLARGQGLDTGSSVAIRQLTASLSGAGDRPRRSPLTVWRPW